jgi:hypothetical protein
MRFPGYFNMLTKLRDVSTASGFGSILYALFKTIFLTRKKSQTKMSEIYSNSFLNIVATLLSALVVASPIDGVWIL